MLILEVKGVCSVSMEAKSKPTNLLIPPLDVSGKENYVYKMSTYGEPGHRFKRCMNVLV